MTPIRKASKPLELTSLCSSRMDRRLELGWVALLGCCAASACIVFTHCCCSLVMVADESLSILMRSNESTITPTKSSIAKKAPRNIQPIE